MVFTISTVILSFKSDNALAANWSPTEEFLVILSIQIGPLKIPVWYLALCDVPSLFVNT
jgi:hypothetical protein